MGHLVPGSTFVPAQGVNVGHVRIDTDPRLGEINLLPELGQGTGIPNLRRISCARSEREGTLALSVAAGIDPDKAMGWELLGELDINLGE